MRQKAYANPVTETFVNDRIDFLHETARFRRIDLRWCLLLEPAQKNPLQRKPQGQTGENARLLANLQKTATILTPRSDRFSAYADSTEWRAPSAF